MRESVIVDDDDRNLHEPPGRMPINFRTMPGGSQARNCFQPPQRKGVKRTIWERSRTIVSFVPKCIRIHHPSILICAGHRETPQISCMIFLPSENRFSMKQAIASLWRQYVMARP